MAKHKKTQIEGIDIKDINPYQKGKDTPYRRLSTLGKIEYYNTIQKRANQSLVDIKKYGLEAYSEAYSNIKSNTKLRTKSGGLGYKKIDTKNPPSNEELIAMTKSVYKTYTSPTTSLPYLRKLKAETLKRLDLPDTSSDEDLKDFWDLYDELVNSGVFDRYVLGSDKAIEITKEFMKQTNIKAGKRKTYNYDRDGKIVREIPKNYRTAARKLADTINNTADIELDKMGKDTTKTTRQLDIMVRLLEKERRRNIKAEYNFTADAFNQLG